MGPVERAVRRDLRKLNPDARASGLARTALALAAQLDGADSPQAAAVVGRELRITLVELRKAAPEVTRSGIDDLRARREQRRRAAGGPAS